MQDALETRGFEQRVHRGLELDRSFLDGTIRESSRVEVAAHFGIFTQRPQQWIERLAFAACGDPDDKRQRVRIGTLGREREPFAHVRKAEGSALGIPTRWRLCRRLA